MTQHVLLVVPLFFVSYLESVGTVVDTLFVSGMLI